MKTSTNWEAIGLCAIYLYTSIAGRYRMQDCYAEQFFTLKTCKACWGEPMTKEMLIALPNWVSKGTILTVTMLPMSPLLIIFRNCTFCYAKMMILYTLTVYYIWRRHTFLLHIFLDVGSFVVTPSEHCISQSHFRENECVPAMLTQWIVTKRTHCSLLFIKPTLCSTILDVYITTKTLVEVKLLLQRKDTQTPQYVRTIVRIVRWHCIGKYRVLVQFNGIEK